MASASVPASPGPDPVPVPPSLSPILPQAPTHILIVPKKCGNLTQLQHAKEEDKAVLGHMLVVAGTIARREGLADDGYRLVINDGKHGGQVVSHLHMHLIGGKALGWPPYSSHE